jgi:hypothetical protein
MLFVKVSDSENDESVEVPVEPQGFILMSTLTAQFPGACGLKFKTEQFSWRGYVFFFSLTYSNYNIKKNQC